MENYRLVAALLLCIQEVDTNTGLALCNPKGCPVMSAGRYASKKIQSVIIIII